MDKEKNSLEKNIDEIKEWQNNQFNPGYWLGGKIPAYELRKNKKLGIAFLMVGIIGLTLNLMYFPLLDLGQQIISVTMTVLLLIAGYFKLKGN